MTGAELRAALDRLGMSQVEFAELCDSHPVTVYRWCESPRVPGPVAALVRELERREDHPYVMKGN